MSESLSASRTSPNVPLRASSSRCCRSTTEASFATVREILRTAVCAPATFALAQLDAPTR